ncbi:MAG: zf-HC2 domain-containing protein [Acidobacteriota bacterium]
MNCSRFEELLSDYIDQTIAPPLSTDFRAHSLQCRDCRALLDDVKTAVKECRTEDVLDMPEWLETSLARIPSEHRPLDCSGFEEIITEFLDGFVPAAVYHRFEEHSSACEKCSDLLTDVVYAVAACHSVHTYEDYEAPTSLIEKLNRVMPSGRRSFRRIFADAATSVFNILLPRATQGAGWSFATASLLVFVTTAMLLFGFSDDGTFTGIYRQAHVKAAELYSEGADLYSQREEVVAEIEQVRSNIGEIWDTIGGEKKEPVDNQPRKDSQAEPKH